jgi:hypothetical protein
VTKKGRDAKRRKAHKARTKAKVRAERAEKACALCGEGDRHLRRLKMVVDGKAVIDQRVCRMCAAVIEVLVRDRRRHRL